MATKNDTTAPELTAEERAEKIRNTPRQSHKRFVELYAIVKEAAPERLDELFADQVGILEQHVDKVRNPIDVAIEKAVESQVALAEKNLLNTDPLNGYAGFVFDPEAFAEKTKERKPRVTKSKSEKVADALGIDGADADQIEALKAALAAAGIEL